MNRTRTNINQFLKTKKHFNQEIKENRLTNQIFEFRFSFFSMNFCLLKKLFFSGIFQKYFEKFIKKKLNRNSKIWLVNRFSLISWLICFLVF